MNTAHDESGDTLLEIVLALVVISLVVGAYFATYATQGTGSTTHRILVTADGVLRSYAEATESAVREQCAPTGATQFSVTYSPSDSDYSVSSLTNQPCPPRATTTAWSPIVLTVTMPNSNTRSLTLAVRSP